MMNADLSSYDSNVIVACCITVNDDEQSTIKAYISYSEDILIEISNFLFSNANILDREHPPTIIRVGDQLYAKSVDDNLWYRAIVEEIEDVNNLFTVYLIDWGTRNKLTSDRLRVLKPIVMSPYFLPGCAIGIRFSDEPGQDILNFLKGEEHYRLRIESMENDGRTMVVTVLSD